VVPYLRVEVASPLRTSVTRALAPVVLFVLLTIALTYPYAVDLGDHVHDAGDPYEYAWVLGFGAYQLTHDPIHLFDGNILYPFPLSLAYSDSSVPDIVLGTPIVLLTDNPVLALNALTLLSFFLAGYGMYLFVAQRTGSRSAGVVAGILYSFNPWRFDHLAQLPNVSIEWAPFALWSFDRYLATGRYRWAAGFALASLLQVLVSFYYAFILGSGIAIYVVARLLQTRASSSRLRRLLPLAASAGIAALVGLPLVLPYFAVERAFGLQRTLGEATAFSAWPANFLAATPSEVVVLIDPLVRLLYHVPWSRAPLGAGERHLYPGTLAIVLAVVGLFQRRRAAVIAPLAMVLVGSALCFGPVFHSSATDTPSLPFPMPYTLLFDYLPGFTALRVPPRFAALVVLGLAILAGDGLAMVQSRLRRPRSWPSLAQPALALALACALVGAVEALNHLSPVPAQTGAAVPPVYRWLAQDPVPGAVVELPIDADAFHVSPRDYFSTYDHRPLVNGFRSFMPPAYGPLSAVIGTFPAPRAISALDRLNVRYVVVHESQLDDHDRSLLGTAARIPGIALAARFGSDVVYRLTGSPAPEHVQLSTPVLGCLTSGTSAGDLTIDLTPSDGEPVLILAPGTRDLTFAVAWQGPNDQSWRVVEHVPVASWVLTSPAKLDLPLRRPVGANVAAFSVSLADQPGLVVDTPPRRILVGGTVPNADALPRLVGASMLSPRPTVASGVSYELEWQVVRASGDPLVAFVDAYDAHGDYWSYPSGTETRFPGSATCPGGYTVENDRVILRSAIPPGHYWVEAGLLDTVTRQRVPFDGPDGQTVSRVVVGSFWITPPSVFTPGSFAEPVAPVGDFGSIIALDRADVAGSVVPGGSLAVDLRWRAEQPAEIDYTAFVHLVNQSGQIAGQHDAQPTDGVYPTSAWLPGETIVDHDQIALPRSLPPGPYHLEVGLYDLKTGQRVPVVGPAGQIQGDHVTVAVPGSPG